MYDPHRSLTPLRLIERRSGGRVAFVFAWRYAEVALLDGRNATSRLARRVIEYVELARNIWRARRAKAIVVREFSTYYFLIVLALCWPLRCRIACIIAHNVQSAEACPSERLLLWLYARAGLRMICLENGQRLAEWVSDPAAVIEIPHPIKAVATAGALAPPGPGKPLLIGFVGDLRPEKGAGQVLDHVMALRERLQIRVLVGTPDPKKLPPAAHAAEIHDTATAGAYTAFLSRVHLLVVPYPARTYAYRASGIVADACAVGTPVLCPALPVLKHQVLSPEMGGLCIAEADFVDGVAIGHAVERVAASWETLRRGMRANAEARRLDRVVDALSDRLGGVAGETTWRQ